MGSRLTREKVEKIVQLAREMGESPNLSGADLSGVDLSATNLSQANLHAANLRHADLSSANFSKADLSKADLSGANLHYTDLVEADLVEADLIEAYVSSANLSGANLRLVKLDNANLSKANLNRVDLSQANLSEANLTGAILFAANLSKTNFSQANLRYADLSQAILFAANLSKANLSYANLSQAHLNRADLTEANLHAADLSQANLNKVIVEWTNFGAVDLSTVKGLDTMRHRGPSTIGIDTIYRSKGNIPEVYLRGCGLSDWEIEATKLYQPDLTSAEFTNIFYKIHALRIIAIHYYSCFISYSSKDQDFAEHIHNDLQAKGVRCWFAPEDLKIGAKIRPTIDETIRLHDKLLLVLSEHSVTSQWVEQEVETALARERKQDETVLFPIRLDNVIMEMEGGWPALIKNTRNIGNFSQWKGHDTYQKAFTRLLRDLKANG